MGDVARMMPGVSYSNPTHEISNLLKSLASQVLSGPYSFLISPQRVHLSSINKFILVRPTSYRLLPARKIWLHRDLLSRSPPLVPCCGSRVRGPARDEHILRHHSGRTN